MCTQNGDAYSLLFNGVFFIQFCLQWPYVLSANKKPPELSSIREWNAIISTDSRNFTRMKTVASSLNYLTLLFIVMH